MKIFEISQRFPKEETYALLIKKGEAQDQFAQTLLNHLEKENILLIS